jgi:SAM-dependent methyltransferase
MTIDPLFYALVHQGQPGDVALYARVCHGAQRVLELGCGYGRVSVPLAVAGAEVSGVDVHEGLLALAERRSRAEPGAVRARLTWLHGDMRDPPVQGLFDRVIIPFSGLYCLPDEADVLRCLRAARAHLREGGKLVFDGYAADGFHLDTAPEDHPDDQLDYVALIAVAGVAYDVYERSTWDRDAQRMVATYVHVPDGGAPDDAIVYEIPQRYLLSGQVSPLLEAAGFRLDAMYGDFAGAPYDADSELMIVSASVRS